MDDFVFVFTIPGCDLVAMIPPAEPRIKIHYQRIALLLRFFYQILL